jgi:hypothetical protein
MCKLYSITPQSSRHRSAFRGINQYVGDPQYARRARSVMLRSKSRPRHGTGFNLNATSVFQVQT